jgi:hypothetical protein
MKRYIPHLVHQDAEKLELSWKIKFYVEETIWQKIKPVNKNW